MPTQDYLLPIEQCLAIERFFAGLLGSDSTEIAAPFTQAQQTLNTMQQRLRNDARDFFARVGTGSTRPEPSHDEGGKPAETLLTALIEAKHDIVLGGLPPLHQTAFSPLITWFAQQKPHPVKIMYVAGLLTDRHQEELDRYHTQPDTPLSTSLSRYITILDQKARRPAEASLLRLLEKAREQGIRIVALDCAATQFTHGLEPRQRLEIANYFAQLRIREVQSQTTDSRWVAWVGETQLNRFEEVPGIAELTGGVGMRLRLTTEAPSPSSMLYQDPGENVVTSKGGRYWVKNDLLLTSQRFIEREALLNRLDTAGKFAILALPETGEFELHHRARKTGLMVTLIQRDAASPYLFFIERLGATTHWAPVLGRRYQSLQDLARALETHVNMTNVWPHQAPPMQKSPIASVGMPRRAGMITPTPAATSTTSSQSGSRAYDMTPDEAERLNKFKQQDHGLDTDYIGYYPDPTDGDAWKRFRAKRQQLLHDAEQFFTNPPKPTRPLPLLQQAFEAPTLSEALRSLVNTFSGIVIGEVHSDRWSKKLLLDYMKLFKESGVRTLYFEHLLADYHQDMLDAWHAKPNAPMPEALRKYFTKQDLGHGTTEGFTFTAVAEAAHQNGIAIVAIDCFSSYHLDGAEMMKNPQYQYNRQKIMNYYAWLRITEHQRQNPQAKWVALVGNSHVGTYGPVIGVANLTGAIGLRIRGETLALQPDVGAWFEADVKTPEAFLQTDLISTPAHTPLSPEIHDRLRMAEGHFAILPEGSGYTLYYRYQNQTVILPITQKAGRVSLDESPWRAVFKQFFGSPTTLAEKLGTVAGLRNVGPALTAPTTEGAPSSSKRTLSAPDADPREAFESLRQSTLYRMVFFATSQEREDFKVGKAHWQDKLAGLGLADSISLEELKKVFVTRHPQLNAQQQGTLLAAIQDRQAQQTQQITLDWRTQIATRGGNVTRTIAHNRYLAAANRPQGLCAGLTAHLAAAWLQDARQPGSNVYFNHYLDAMARAIQAPDTPSARLLDLGLTAWQVGDPKQAFGTHTPQSGLSPTAVLAQLDNTTAPAAFELALGSHAMLLTKSGTPGTEHFSLIDPNFGRCEIPNRQTLQTILEWHGTLTRQLFTPETTSVSFTLRRYRDDLPTQRLFAQHDVGWLAVLPVTDLCQPDALARRIEARRQPLTEDAKFLRLQRQLTVAEYRQRQSSMAKLDPVSTLLNDILSRHQTSPSSPRAPTRALKIAFSDDNAFVTLDVGGGLASAPMLIDGTQYPQDVAQLRQLKALMAEMKEDNVSARLGRLLLPRRTPVLEVDRQILTAALPDHLPTRVVL